MQPFQTYRHVYLRRMMSTLTWENVKRAVRGRPDFGRGGNASYWTL